MSKLDTPSATEQLSTRLREAACRDRSELSPADAALMEEAARTLEQRSETGLREVRAYLDEQYTTATPAADILDGLEKILNAEGGEVARHTRMVHSLPKALEARPSAPSAIVPSDRLRTEALNAINKLESLGRTFSSTNFTDRYADGPHCLDLAKRLKEALNGA